jgi:hypothetical protein
LQLRLRLSRNKKTGASRHFAFIEFDDAEVGGSVGSHTPQPSLQPR